MTGNDANTFFKRKAGYHKNRKDKRNHGRGNKKRDIRRSAEER